MLGFHFFCGFSLCFSNVDMDNYGSHFLGHALMDLSYVLAHDMIYAYGMEFFVVGTQNF